MSLKFERKCIQITFNRWHGRFCQLWRKISWEVGSSLGPRPFHHTATLRRSRPGAWRFRGEHLVPTHLLSRGEQVASTDEVGADFPRPGVGSTPYGYWATTSLLFLRLGNEARKRQENRNKYYRSKSPTQCNSTTVHINTKTPDWMPPTPCRNPVHPI